jgi:hypothetical protein
MDQATISEIIKYLKDLLIKNGFLELFFIASLDNSCFKIKR